MPIQFLTVCSKDRRKILVSGEAHGARAYLIMEPSDVSAVWLEGASSVGVTSGASTPEKLVEDVLGCLVLMSPVAQIEVLETTKESMEFRPPRDLVELAMAKS